MYNKGMSKKTTLFSLALIFSPLITYAHVKWFAESVNPVRPYALTDIPVISAIIIVFIIILIGIYLEKKLTLPKWFEVFENKWAAYFLSIASIGFGLSFLIFSYYGFIFAPNLLATGQFGNTLILIQTLAGAMILFGIYERVGGLLLVVLFAFGIRAYGLTEMVDTLEMLGFALYAMIIGRPKWKIVDTNILQRISHRIHSYGLPLLRVGTGLNLIILGFSEKILTPSLTENFLSQYHWNFMQTIGFEQFSDYWFAFSAGATETLFGIFFLLGLVTRVTTLALSVFLTTSLILLGPIELIGHLPHFSIAIVLLVLGSGSRLHIGRIKREQASD